MVLTLNAKTNIISFMNKINYDYAIIVKIKDQYETIEITKKEHAFLWRLTLSMKVQDAYLADVHGGRFDWKCSEKLQVKFDVESIAAMMYLFGTGYAKRVYSDGRRANEK